MADVCRVPFGELSGDRLQKLSNVKNRQNGIVAAADSIKSAPASVQSGKRSYDMSMLEFDSENIDPASFTSGTKKTKCEPILFASSVTPFKSLPPPRLPHSERTLSSRSSISKTPAGRSPKKSSRSLFARSFKRIDPPFASASSALPFSLDAALSNTVSNAQPKARPPMPSKWQFTIYEDSPEEEAATVMEQSTLTLDLSSDDEASVAKKSDRGKENTPPEGYSTAHPRTHARSNESQASEVMKVDDTPRSPLADLPESEVPLLEPASVSAGTLSKDESSQPEEQQESTIIVAKPVNDSLVVATPSSSVPVHSPQATEPKSTSVDGKPQEQSNEEIVIFEDETAA